MSSVEWDLQVGKPPKMRDRKWEMPERFNALRVALDLLPHAQTPIGMGYKLTHAPTNCVRCRAEIALLEISTIVQTPTEVKDDS